MLLKNNLALIDELANRLLETAQELSIRFQIQDIGQRITEIELRQQGTKILEDMLGYQIGD